MGRGTDGRLLILPLLPRVCEASLTVRVRLRVDCPAADPLPVAVAAVAAAGEVTDIADGPGKVSPNTEPLTRGPPSGGVRGRIAGAGAGGDTGTADSLVLVGVVASLLLVDPLSKPSDSIWNKL